jgi:dTDP-4-dehydrorhamnose 3,5-epimerase
MKFLASELPEVVVVEPDVFRDPRGWFLETFHAQKYQAGGIPPPFVQDNLSRSIYGTLRGLHAQECHPQGKLVRVIAGEILDVAVDIRRGSPRFGRWVGIHLSGEAKRACYVPPGFAHGFCVLSSEAIVEYKCTDFYDPADEMGILWSDPDLGIPWPVSAPILSAKDAQLPLLRDLQDRLPRYPVTSDPR